MFPLIKFSRKLRLAGVVNISCILTFIMLFGLLHLNINLWTSSWLEKNSSISLFLSSNISETTYQNLYDTLEQDFRIQHIREISSEEAFIILNQQMEKDQGILDSIDKTILPTTIDLEIHPEYYSQTAITVKKLQSLEGITEIVYPKQTLETLSHVSQGLNRFAIVLLFLGGGLVIFILFYLLYLSFQQHLQELELLNLFGASFFSILLPFLIEVGMVLGISTLLSYSITFICYQTSFYLPSFQGISLFFNQSAIFYNWQDLLISGLLTLLIGEGYTYWMINRWCSQLRIRSN